MLSPASKVPHWQTLHGPAAIVAVTAYFIEHPWTDLFLLTKLGIYGLCFILSEIIQPCIQIGWWLARKTGHSLKRRRRVPMTADDTLPTFHFFLAIVVLLTYFWSHPLQSISTLDALSIYGLVAMATVIWVYLSFKVRALRDSLGISSRVTLLVTLAVIASSVAVLAATPWIGAAASNQGDSCSLSGSPKPAK